MRFCSNKIARRRCRQPSSRIARSGLTLFEVVLALAVFLGTLAALSQLTSTGTRAAAWAQLQTQAVIRCESKLAEIIAGVEKAETVRTVKYIDDPKWNWSLLIKPTSHPDLIDLEVTVQRVVKHSQDVVTHTLVQLVREPRLFHDAEALKAIGEKK